MMRYYLFDSAAWQRGWLFGPALVLFMVCAWSPQALALDLNEANKVVHLEGTWLFQNGDNPAFKRPGLDDYRWLERQLPSQHNTWSERWAGYGWYRLHLHLGFEPTDLALSLGAVREAAEVYLNGSLVARRGSFDGAVRSEERNIAMVAPLPKGLLMEGDNVVAIRIFDPSYDAGIPAGPLAVGPPEAIQKLVSKQNRRVLTLRFSLGFLAIFVSLLQVIMQIGRRGGEQYWWLALAGMALGGVHLSGIDVFAIVPSAELAARIPMVLGPLAALGIGSFFSSRFGDAGTQSVRIARYVILVFCAALLLMPATWAFFAGPPILMVVALLINLYCAHLCAQGIRRGEDMALGLFLVVCAEGALLIYDGWMATTSAVLPPLSVMGAVAVVAITAVAGSRQAVGEQLRTMQKHARARQARGDVALLDLALLSKKSPFEFLQGAIQQVSQQLSVRRCSLVLATPAGDLRMVASVGVPKVAAYSVLPKDSLSARVFGSGTPLSSREQPETSGLGKRGRYLTKAFHCAPVLMGGKPVGVLNLSDRNDGGEFNEVHEQSILSLADKISEALAWLGDLPFETLPQAGEEAAQVVPRQEGPAPKAKASAGPDTTTPRGSKETPGHKPKAPAEAPTPAASKPSAPSAPAAPSPKAATSPKAPAPSVPVPQTATAKPMPKAPSVPAPAKPAAPADGAKAPEDVDDIAAWVDDIVGS